MYNFEILSGEFGAHNLYIVDARTHRELGARRCPSAQGVAWGLGGQFRGHGSLSQKSGWMVSGSILSAAPRPGGRSIAIVKRSL